MDLRSTLNLPDADATIPMKANLPSLEASIQAIWAEKDIYHQLQVARKSAPAFVLHDGPPYTNSPVHIGTAMNKILKDFVLKSRSMMGFRTPYVPGFDNHGLPIEQAVMKKFQEKKITPTGAELRQACREHAEEFIKVQTEQFKRLGVFGLWDNPYKTMGFRYEAELVRTFKRLLESGHVYKGLRPTLWSPTSRTALADTEIEYHDHTSRAIYVRFALREDPNRIFEPFQNLYTIIWTTTPWTIPANLAVAFHPEFEYSFVRINGDPEKPTYLVLSALVEKLTAELGWVDPEVLATMEGINFDRASFSHPLFDRPSLAVMANYVTTEDGTGVVHTAPSHGRDDFYTGQKYSLPVPNTVDERGVLTEEAGEFAGTFYKTCDTVVVDRLAESGALLKAYDYHHSYPYAERDGQPVIFRATEQWFLSIDPLREAMLENIDAVTWTPPTGQNRIDAMVRNRPDWCISRQRPWGVGIPIFYALPSRTPLLDPDAIESVARIIERHGSGAWFELSPEELLPKGYAHPETGETEFTKETDVLDVWFDSGASSLCVLEGNVYPEWKENYPADLYLEGSDQHRGWFNTSLILGMAVRGEAPYKAVLTHGFVMDAKGQKMSKRLGNVIDPVKAAEQYGADILRYWMSSVDYTNDVPCSDELLKQIGESYRNVRNTLRFLLSNLAGFDPGSPVQTLAIDEWIMEQVDLLASECVQNYEVFDFGSVINAIHNFCREELSKFYLDAIKDRMYCEAKDSELRRSGQAACRYVLVTLLKLLAPIIPHTAEETWAKLNGSGAASIFFETFDRPTDERLMAIEASSIQVQFAALLGLRDDVNVNFESFKGTDDVKDSQDAVAEAWIDPAEYEVLQSFSTEELATLLKLSWITLHPGEGDIKFAKSSYAKCERSRLRRPDVEPVQIDGEAVLLSARDRAVLGL